MKETKANEQFIKLVTTFTEQKEQTKKVYFKKLSFATLFVIITFLTVISFTYMGYYNFNNNPLININVLEAKTFIYGFFAISTALALILINPRQVNLALFFIIPVLILCLILSYLFSGSSEHIIFPIIILILIGLGMGFIFSAAILAFVYTLNSSERLVASLLTVISVLVYFVLERFLSFLSPIIGDLFLPLVILSSLYVIIFFVNKDDFTKIEFKEEKVSFLAVIFSTILIICFVMNEAIFSAVKVNITNNYHYFSDMFFYIGSLIGLVITFFIYLWFRYALVFLSFIWFFTAWATYQLGVLYLFVNHNLLLLHSLEISMGFVSAIGLVTGVLLLGKVFEDKVNNRIFKIVTLFLAFSFLSSRFLSIALQGMNLPIIFIIMQGILFFSTIVLVVFVVIIFIYPQPKKEKTSEVPEAFKNDQLGLVNPYDILTTKEVIVFEQLLGGLTLRQIAGELKMKYDTVNFHYKNIYRKLEVNSKIELIMRYGRQ